MGTRPGSGMHGHGYGSASLTCSQLWKGARVVALFTTLRDVTYQPACLATLGALVPLLSNPHELRRRVHPDGNIADRVLESLTSGKRG